jgi:hypothetical protein
MYQADAVANTYGTLGYLVAIISILGFCIMPRAKFIQTMTLNVLVVCFGSAVALLELWSSVKAREHTTPAGLPPARYRYNSSQSAVCAVWLFFQIWICNTMKAKFPQFAFPVILYAILVNIASTYGPQFQTLAQVENFVKTLLISFLTGLGIATGVSFLVFPVSCRFVVTKQITGYIGALRGALGAHRNYFQSMETNDMFRQTTWTPESGEKEKEKLKKPRLKPEVEAVKNLTATFTALHGKLHGDLPFAKREMAYGKLTPEDFESIFKHLRGIMMPLVGLGSLIDLFERVADLQHFEEGSENENPDPNLHSKMVDDWNDLMRFLHDPLAGIITAMDQGLEHVLIRFELTKVPEKKKGGNATDPEEKGNLVVPGDAAFAAHLEAQSNAFYQGKETTLRHWLESKGLKLRENFFDNANSEGDPENINLQRIPTRHRQQRQLYVVLYIMFLLHSISRSILAFVQFADERDQATTKKRFISPGKRRFRKWIASTFSRQDSNNDDEMTGAGLEQNSSVVYMGDAFRDRKDPEHLAPKNAWEKFGNGIRAASRFLGSWESAFGFRCACATMTIAIVAFLGDTQRWFVEQRLVWAMYVFPSTNSPLMLLLPSFIRYLYSLRRCPSLFKHLLILYLRLVGLWLPSAWYLRPAQPSSPSFSASSALLSPC